MSEHTPDRPTWNCRNCRAPWPCPPARTRLMAELDSIALAMYAWICLEEAAGDLTTATPVHLFQRFLHWTRPAPEPATPPPSPYQPETAPRRTDR